ncbi:Retroviral-like aspartic protease 1 [Holothuria leucospilota]|uniref:Retroviral-like aspartic protease 1 n=1 Tax=Holothuria leucospilota TaxID=206669 RepID=A0A9Q0YE63_HOLLE|nr:Retroviral-like aspartic protease 1 [Holothuria leucospilota]
MVNSPPTDHDQTGGGVNAGDYGAETSIRISTAGVQPARDGLLSTESASKITGGLRVPPGFESSISSGFQSRDAYRGSPGKKVHFSSAPVIDRPETLPHQTLGFGEEFLELPPSLGNLGKWRVGQPRTEATIPQKELSKPKFRKTKPGKRQWTEPVGCGEVQGSYIERPTEQVSRELAHKRDMDDRDQICVTPSGPTALAKAERNGRNSDAPVVSRKHESGAGSPVDSGQGGCDPYGVVPLKPVDTVSPTGGNNMAGCSMVAEEKLEQVDDCCNKSLHSKSNVSGERAYGKLPQTTPQDTEHETMGRSCKESPGEIGGRPRVGTIRKGRLVSVYLEGSIQEETIKFLVDSGSSMSFLSKKYLELVPDKDEDLKPTGVPQQLADGSPLEVLGQVELVVKLEGRPLIVEFQVAELDLEGILGLDFLDSHRCQWDWDNCSMVVAGVAVPLIRGIRYDDPIVSKVQAKENFVVPAGHEMLVFGEVPETQVSGRVAEIRPKGKFIERTGLLVARALVKPGSSRVLIRLMNPGTEDVKVWTKTCMAVFHKLDEADDILGTISPHQENDDPVEDVRPKERRTIPPHLIDLYNRSTQESDRKQPEDVPQDLGLIERETPQGEQGGTTGSSLSPAEGPCPPNQVEGTTETPTRALDSPPLASPPNVRDTSGILPAKFTRRVRPIRIPKRYAL